MAMAVVLAFHFPKARKVVYVLAVLIGFSRVYFGVHYLSDVLAGFILGSAVGLLSILLERAILAVNKGLDLRS
jgi:undecaprenyl-diphosphatase